MQLEDSATNMPSETYRAFHDYFEIILVDTNELLDEVFKLRYQIYCVEHPFEDQAAYPDGREQDEYDARAAHILIRHKRTDYYAATARLILPDESNPSSAFPLEHACMGHFFEETRPWIADLDRRKVAEISRFAVAKEFRRRLGESATISGASPQATYLDAQGPGGQMRRFPHIILGLFAAIFRISSDRGIAHLFAVMEPTLLRLLRRFGVYFPPIGPLVEYHGLRRPTLAVVDTVVEGILRERPDVWEIVTDRGRFVPRTATRMVE